MSRISILIPALCVVFAACSSSSKSATSTTTAAPPPTTSTSASPSTTIATTRKESVFVLSVDPTAHTIHVDPMEFLTGQAAVTAFHKTNPNATGGPDNDYYIENPVKNDVEMPLEADAVVKVVQAGGSVHTNPVAVPQSTLASYPALPDHPFWITIQRGVVTEVDEQFVP
jgi:ABC-type Fe3+-hydroxamate transport system substrate-binding protein